MMTRNLGAGLLRNVWVVACLWARVLGAEPPKTRPDLNQDSKVDRKLTDNLGATDLRGGILKLNRWRSGKSDEVRSDMPQCPQQTYGSHFRPARA